jgi:hypothetical protein
MAAVSNNQFPVDQFDPQVLKLKTISLDSLSGN